jgi:hypothetical protein
MVSSQLQKFLNYKTIDFLMQLVGNNLLGIKSIIKRVKSEY